VATSPAVLAGELIAALVIIGSVALLAHRGTQLRREIERAPQRGSSRVAWG
jgi:hypothetical protein